MYKKELSEFWMKRLLIKAMVKVQEYCHVWKLLKKDDMTLSMIKDGKIKIQVRNAILH